MRSCMSIPTYHSSSKTTSLLGQSMEQTRQGPQCPPPSEKTAPTGSAAARTPCNQNAMIEILDNNVEDDVSVLTGWLLSWSRPGDKSTRPPAVGLPLAPVSSLEAAQLPYLPPPTRAVSRLPPPMAPPAVLVVQPSTGRQAMGRVTNSHYQISPCIHEEGDNKQA
jgi:hypothetical protein